MIKVIVGYKVKDVTQIQPILLKVRSQAMTYRGFVRSEILLSENKKGVVSHLRLHPKNGHKKGIRTPVSSEATLP